MPYRGEAFTPGQYYHVYNRGAGKQKIFLVEDNYQYLLQLSTGYAHKYSIRLIAYCLMPNHYHFILRQESDEPLSKFLNALFGTYVQALNRQQGRSGTLFEGRFRHKRVADLAYVLRLARYIHMNPVRAGLASCPEEWKYSDYGEWAGLKDVRVGDADFIRGNFPGAGEYSAFVAEAANQERHEQKLLEYVWD